MCKRAIPMIIIVFLVAGCFRQSNDSFETITSDNDTDNGGIVITERPTTAPATDVPTEATEAIDAQQADPSATPLPTETSAPTATDEIITIDPTASPTRDAIISATDRPDDDDTGDATQFITPEPVVELIEATATPSPVPTTRDIVEDNQPDTDDDPVSADADARCVYTVRSGDTLYGIALGNSVRLNDLLRANSLRDTSIIRPGDDLILPLDGCVEDTTTETETETASATATEAPAEVVIDGETVYRVSSGDTLSGIAARYDVSVRQLMDANGITNPDRLSIGQELVIPDTNATPNPTPTATATPPASDGEADATNAQD
jgi:LysM repeat protein